MKCRKAWSICLLLLLLAAAPAFAGKNVILMVPDGMGLSNVTIARTFRYGPAGGRLGFESLPYIGYQRTASRNSYITDSAAAASAWSSGEKFNNGEIACRDHDGDGRCDGTRVNRKTILELARDKGMATGLVVTSDITHATPAAFGAHVHSRDCQAEIFRQMLANHIDVMMGGGIGANRGDCKCGSGDDGDRLIARARQQGYLLVRNKTEMAAATGAPKLLGLFRDGGLTPMYQRTERSPEPTLARMTRAALATLEKNANGFFLLVEGSQVDWANHSRNLDYQVHEMIDFDNAVRNAMEWIDATPARKEEMMLIVTTDHECGGVIIEGPDGSLPDAGDPDSQAIRFGANCSDPDKNADHTGVDTLIWSNRPECGKAMENTDLFFIMKDFLGI